MNILFFLTPKNDVAFLHENNTLRQALEKMEYHRYTVIPILKKNGEYYGTLTEGDLLWYIKSNADLNLAEAEDISVSDIPRNKDYMPVKVTEPIDSLVALAQIQNFVPVIDGKKSFIGIIKRKDIIEYCYKCFKDKK